MKIEKCSSPSDALEKLADKIESDSQKPGDFCVAFSGGESAKKMFPVLARRNMDFSRFKIFFVDERCVFPDSQDSNYRWARELFIEPLNIPKERVFRLRGEECPITAADEASRAALENVPSENGFPVFDCVVLGGRGRYAYCIYFSGHARALGIAESVRGMPPASVEILADYTHGKGSA